MGGLRDSAARSAGFGGGSISLPVSVANGGTSGTDQATARSGLGLGSAAVEALTTDGTTVTGALGAADPRVASAQRTQYGTTLLGTSSAQLQSGWQGSAYRGIGSHCHTTAAGAIANGVLSLGATDGTGGTISMIGVDVSTAGAAGATAVICIYSVGTTLGGCDLLWSGTVTTTSTGARTIALSAGTFTTAGNAYKDGSSRFVIPQGVRLFVGMLNLVSSGSTSYRFPAGANSVSYGASIAGGSNTPFYTSLVQNSLAAVPATLSSATEQIAGSSPLVYFQEV